MGDKSGIEWTNATWNPIRGCTRVSEGCRHCYAERVAVRQVHGAYAGLVKSTPAGPRWTGDVRFVEDALTLPLRWKSPRRIFVNSMSDLFHEKVEDAWIDQIFAVMALARQHTFQVLTKRPERMRDYMATPLSKRAIAATVMDLSERRAREEGTGKARIKLDDFSDAFNGDGAFPNVHLGVSVEDAETYKSRVLYLANTPAAVRFVSMEPLLADLGDLMLDGIYEGAYQWAIVGGESGPGARPPHPDWFRSARDQCVAAGVRFFFKQWGEYAPVPKRDDGPGRMVRAGDVVVTPDGRRAPIARDLSCTLEGEGIPMRRVGKTEAGRVLDGMTWEQYPDDPADQMF